jgi:hypothetical protein
MDLKKHVMKMWTRFEFRYDTVASSCEYGNEPPGFMKGKEFFDQLCDCRFIKKDPDQ